MFISKATARVISDQRSITLFLLQWNKEMQLTD